MLSAISLDNMPHVMGNMSWLFWAITSNLLLQCIL